MSCGFKKWDTATFHTVQSDLVQYDGEKCTVLRRLTEDEADLNETGPMYHVCIGPCWADESKRIEVDCFEDELTADSGTIFYRMVDLYRALGYRMVAFERECEGGWLMAFDTHGVNAETFPKEAFDVPACQEWCRYLGWDSVTSEDVHIYDDTDDPGFLVGSYDWEADYPVLQLATH